MTVDTKDRIAWPLLGHASSERKFLEAFASQRMHHGWILEGPSGIGKATLAKRMIAKVLGAACKPDTLDADQSDPVVQKIMAEAHPDVRWLARRPDEKGKLKQDIAVEAVRGLNEFFFLKAGLGGWRVGVIDSMDELNRFGANAILKTLEEPPPQCLLIIISHRTRSVLPTIRSRCRLLRLSALDRATTQSVLDMSDHPMARESVTVDLSRGRPGYGLKLASDSGFAAANAAKSFLRNLPKVADVVISDTVVRGGADEMAFRALHSEVLSWLNERADENPKYADSWLAVSRLVSESHALNMDYTQSASKLISIVQRAAQKIEAA